MRFLGIIYIYIYISEYYIVKTARSKKYQLKNIHVGAPVQWLERFNLTPIWQYRARSLRLYTFNNLTIYTYAATRAIYMHKGTIGSIVNIIEGILRPGLTKVRKFKNVYTK